MADQIDLERRIAQRYQVKKLGWINFGTDDTVEVRIICLSETGARLEACKKVEFPENCSLQVQAEQLSYPIHIAWQRELEIGVTFTGEPHFSDSEEQD